MTGIMHNYNIVAGYNSYVNLQPNEFINWLDGFLADKNEVNPSGVQLINNKLQTVFNKQTPYQGNSTYTMPNYTIVGSDKGHDYNKTNFTSGVDSNQLLFNIPISC